MMKFEFAPEKSQTKFSGRIFYEIYKGAEFLGNKEHVAKILCRGYELRQSLKKVAPGESIIVADMNIENNKPLLVKNTFGANVTVEDFEFTYNRLTGLVAAYVYDNRHSFQNLTASEAGAIGLVWKHDDERASKLYLSAVSGTEHFPQFSFFPLVCALKKLQLGKITVPPVVKIAKIKNDAGERMAAVLMKNFILTNDLWGHFGGPPSTKTNLRAMLSSAPDELKKVFVTKEK